MTTQAEISKRFDEGVKAKLGFMIVVQDTLSHEDYFVYTSPDPEDFWKKHKQYNGVNMQTIMEVYDLSKPKHEQLKTIRVNNHPVPFPTKREDQSRLIAWGSGDGHWVRPEDRALRPDAYKFIIPFYKD